MGWGIQVGGREDTCDNILKVILTDISQGLAVGAGVGGGMKVMAGNWLEQWVCYGGSTY